MLQGFCVADCSGGNSCEILAIALAVVVAGVMRTPEFTEAEFSVFEKDEMRVVAETLPRCYFLYA